MTKVIGGSAVPVYLVKDSELLENGGERKVLGGSAVPFYGMGGSSEIPVPINEGGTGATTAEDALQNLERLVTASITGTYTVNGNNGTVFHLTLTGSVTIDFENITGTRAVTVHLIQDNVGGRVVTWTGVTWPEGGIPTLSTTANRRDKLVFDAGPGGAVDGQLIGIHYS
jgi:hypothetical protein